MEKFFIFLDIDGTLWDRRQTASLTNEHDEFNPESVEALNCLYESLQKLNYEPLVVIISKQRANWERCLKMLRANNIPYNIPLLRLPIGKFTRGERISIFLHDYSRGKNIANHQRTFTVLDKLKVNQAEKVTNYVVIDDDRSALINIPENHHIQTDINFRSLDKRHVDWFLGELEDELSSNSEK